MEASVEEQFEAIGLEVSASGVVDFAGGRSGEHCFSGYSVLLDTAC